MKSRWRLARTHGVYSGLAAGLLMSCIGGGETPIDATGGMGTGGSAPATGGSATTGGANVGVGGAPTGGRSTGGSTTTTGGTPSGGVATSGGTSTGGKATGGKATGGTPTGGPATGGAPTGGRSTGGAPTGGSGTGGCQKGTTKGNEVAIIGESFIALGSIPETIESQAQAAGSLGANEHYIDNSVSGTTLANDQIPCQYRNAQASNNIRFVLMDGGGNDCLARPTTPTEPSVRQGRCSRP